jgi:hypothetical protein
VQISNFLLSQTSVNGQVACGSALVTGTVVSAPNFRQEAQGAGVVSGSASMAAVDFDQSFSSLLFTNQQICSLTCKRTPGTHRAHATRHTSHTT